MTAPATSAAPPRPELRALTSVRGIAAWWVVAFHTRFAMDWLPEPVLAVAAKGYLAVDFFFLLSGFVIWWSSVDRVRGGGAGATVEFLRRRIARIWPLHLFMLSGAVALALLFWATGRHDPAEFPFGELPLHILLIQNWGFTDALSWNDPAWSISCELAAYLAFPMLVMAVDWRRLHPAVLIAIAAALLIGLHLMFAAQGARQLGQLIPTIGVWRCLFEFAAGSVVAALWLRWRARPALPGVMAAALAAIALAAWGAGAPETLAVPVALAGSLLALALSCGAKGHPLEGRAVHYLGEISYATYLSHFLLWLGFKLAFVADPRAVPVWMMACFAVLVLIASVLLYHLVERPAQRWINAISLSRHPRNPRSGTGTNHQPVH